MQNKNAFLFCIVLIYSYLSPLEKILSLGKKKKNKLFFFFSLAYSYLCNHN